MSHLPITALVAGDEGISNRIHELTERQLGICSHLPETLLDERNSRGALLAPLVYLVDVEWLSGSRVVPALAFRERDEIGRTSESIRVLPEIQWYL